MLNHPILQHIQVRGWVVVASRTAGAPIDMPEFNTPRAYYLYQTPTDSDLLDKVVPGPWVTVRHGLPADREKVSWLYTANDGPCYYMVRPAVPLFGISKTGLTTIDAMLRHDGLAGAFSHLVLQMPEDPIFKLRGAEDLLKSLSVIMLRGVAGGSDLDTFLFDRGFVRLTDDGSGEVVFVRAEWVGDPTMLASRHDNRVSVSKWCGRFGNQIFQYTHAKLYGIRRNAGVTVPNWHGDLFFSLPPPTVEDTTLYPRMGCYSFDLTLCELWADTMSPVDLDLHGYFQIVPPTWSAWYRPLYRRILAIRSDIDHAITTWRDEVTTPGKTLIGLHVRRGDYLEANVQMFQVLPMEWYHQLLADIARHIPDFCLFIATNDPDVIADFSDYDVVNAKAPRPDISIDGWDYLFDFGMMARCDVLAISNSSFSRAAAMLAPESQIAFFPNFREGGFRPFAAWSEVSFWEHIAPSYNAAAFSHERALSYMPAHMRSRLVLDPAGQAALLALQRALPTRAVVVQFGGDWFTDELKRALPYAEVSSPAFDMGIDDWRTARSLSKVDLIVLGNFDPLPPGERLDRAVRLLEERAVGAIIIIVEPGKIFDPTTLALDLSVYRFHLCDDGKMWGLPPEQYQDHATGDRKTVLILHQRLLDILHVR